MQTNLLETDFTTDLATDLISCFDNLLLSISFFQFNVFQFLFSMYRILVAG